MPADDAPHPQVAGGTRRYTAIAIILFAIVSLSYAIQAVTLAMRAPYWMDEVLSVWTARQPNVAAIWSALRHGAEFAPPLYDLMLHGLIAFGLSDSLAMRLPSILAIYLAALAMMVFVRRRAGWLEAMLAFAVVLTSGSFAYAVQARPYACVTAAFAWALVAWDRDTTQRLPGWRLAALCGLLVIAVALHFYAVLLVAALGLAEFVRAAIERRRVCPKIIVAISVAILSVLLWWPIARASGIYSAADTAALGYYGRPTLARLFDSYGSLFGWISLPLVGLVVVVTLRSARPFAARVHLALAIILCVVPVGVFAFALVVSHSFSTRYAVSAVLGLALLMAWLVGRLGVAREKTAVGLLALLAAGGLWQDGGEIARPARLHTFALVRAAPADLPILTGSGLRFLEFRENEPASVARRVTFLDTPGVVSADPTNRHQVMRWKAIRPELAAVDGAAFLCATPAFLLLTDPEGGVDDVPQWLAGRAHFAAPPADRAFLTLVRTTPCTTRPDGGFIR